MSNTFPTASYVKKWKVRLRLEDWRIKSKWVSVKEIEKIAGTGACAATDLQDWSVYNKSAIILLGKGCFSNERELEKTIVHELTHILLWPLTKSFFEAKWTKREEATLEQIIVTLEEALCPKESQIKPGEKSS